MPDADSDKARQVCHIETGPNGHGREKGVSKYVTDLQLQIIRYKGLRGDEIKQTSIDEASGMYTETKEAGA